MNANPITFRRQLTGLAFAAPFLVGFVVFLLLPVLLSFYYSFCDYSPLNWPMWIGLDNYRALLHDPVFHKALLNTLLYALCAVPLSLAASVLLAVLLNLPVRCRAFFRTVVFLPSLVPAVAAGMIWLWVLNGKNGLLNIVLARLYGIVIHPIDFLSFRMPASPLPTSLPNWLGNEALIKPVLVLLSLYAVGNAVVIFLAGLQDIPAELYESAQLDGATCRQRFFHITLPMLSPIIFFNLIMGLIAACQFFTLPFTLLPEGGPNRSAYFYSEYIFEAAFVQRRLGIASAMAWLQMLLILTLTWIVIRASRRWVHYR